MRNFDRSLPMALLKARESVMKTFLPHLRAHDLSPQQWRVLRALNDANELEISTLAARCYLLMPSLSRIISNLEKRNLVQRRTSLRDQRCSIISLSPSGQELVHIMMPESEAGYAHITAVYGHDKLELLYELLNELETKLDAARQQDTAEICSETGD